MRRESGATLFVCLTALGAIGCLAIAFSRWHSIDPIQFLCYFAAALVASSFKVTLPGIEGAISINFLFILLGILELSFAETLLLGLGSVLVQCYWNSSKPPQRIQVIFNLSQLTVAATAAYLTYQFLAANAFRGMHIAALVMAGFLYFAFTSAAMALILAVTEGKNAGEVWWRCYFWSFPFYLVGAVIAEGMHFLDKRMGWQSTLLLVPAVYLAYRCCRWYLEKLESGKAHAEKMAMLHLRTIEALALAIEAKDQTAHQHLQRVRVYAIDLAKELGLSHDETEAVRAASILHDIGKLAVPEHIISKPGRLTPEEFEKMKIHPIIGAEILEHVEFPYPVVPIVRSHHEKWDGTGYPRGLKGEEIPIGARILSAVDCLDALASDRQYRPALPLDEAMKQIVSESGSSFDPGVVRVLKRRYLELEKLAHAKGPSTLIRLSTEVKAQRRVSPAAGFEESNTPLATPAAASHDYLSSIAAARQEAQMLFELSHDLGTSLSLDDTLSMLSVRLKRLVPHDSMAVYIKREEHLVPEYVSGDNFRLFSSLKIPLGQGLSGWVAQNNKPIVNGNPSVEPGYLNDPTKYSTLRSALAVPLGGVSEVVGTLALYRSNQDAFTQDHLRILLVVSSKLGFTIENALKYRLAEDSATTDYLTGLPNVRSLFLYLDREIARCKRSGTPIAVLVCDLDGFKQVNDRFGHLQGNRLLQLFAGALKDCCREYDYAARMGGDEFVIVAPGLDSHTATEMVQRLQEAVRAAGRKVCADETLSVSVGCAFYPDDAIDAEQLLAEADRFMYGVKRMHHAAVTEPETATAASAGNS